MQTLLIVEDEAAMREGIADAMRFHGYHVETAGDGEQAAALVAQRHFDLVILDVMLPHRDGFSLCRDWRQSGLATPVLMLTARGEEESLLRGLELGADDYMTKPFSVRELLARVASLLRRAGSPATLSQEAPFAGGTVNFDRLEFRRGRTTITLSDLDIRLIRYLLLNPDRVISRSELLDRIWAIACDDLETRKVDMEMAKLRRKLGSQAEKQLVTVRGGGYIYRSTRLARP